MRCEILLESVWEISRVSNASPEIIAAGLNLHNLFSDIIFVLLILECCRVLNLSNSTRTSNDCSRWNRLVVLCCYVNMELRKHLIISDCTNNKLPAFIANRNVKIFTFSL